MDQVARKAYETLIGLADAWADAIHLIFAFIS
jgi:hypothetical protein